MRPRSQESKPRRLVLIHEQTGELPDAVTEQKDGIYLFRCRPSSLAIERLRDAPDAGQPHPVASLTPSHEKVAPQWLEGEDLVYLGERTAPDGKPLSGQALYRTSISDPGRISRIAEYALGNFHWVAHKGPVRFFERIGTGHDVYYEDGFLAWDTQSESTVEQLEKLPEGVTPVFPPYLHSFSSRQGAPTLELGAHQFSLKRLRAGNDATWAIERASMGAKPKLVTTETETVSCARLANDRLFYLRGPAGGAGISGDNILVCHIAANPEARIEAPCGLAANYRISAGRSSLFHVHGDLIVVATDHLRVFRLE